MKAQEKTEEKKELTIQEKVKILAKAFGIHPVGISVLHDGKPYINAVGLQIARLAFPDAVKIEETGFIKTYNQYGEVAIAYAKGKRGTDNITEVGTASSGNLSMVKDYPNEMAMTRAINRFLRPAVLPLLYKTYYGKLEKKELSEEEVLVVESFLDFGRVSSEETKEGEQPEPKTEGFISFEDMQLILPFLKRILEAKTIEELEAVSQDIGTKIKDFTESQKTKLREAFVKAKEKLGAV